jgi:hypothetical protein
MARSIQYWYDIIIAEKNSMSNLNTLQPNIDSAQTLLTDVTSTSKVARWRLWVWAFATCAYTLDVLFDLFKLELEDISKKSRYGTLPWYVYTAYSYQHGDSLVYQNNQYEYASINPANQIVKRAAAQESGNTVNLKIAKLSGANLVPLTNIEKAAFIAYIDQRRPAGVTVNVISEAADELRLFLKVNYDPLVLTSTGELISSPGTYPVETVINNYLKALPFAGILELCFLVDEIQRAFGVSTCYITSASARYGSNPFVVFPEKYSPNAGYLTIDPSTPLSTTTVYASI